MKILLVDDSIMIRNVLKKYVLYFFEMNNWEEPSICEAEDGLIAIQHIETQKVDIIFLDYNMPNMNGNEVLEAVRKNPKLNKVKIIMATTEGSKKVVSSLIKKGANGYLIKPFIEKSVYKTLSAITGRIKS